MASYFDQTIQSIQHQRWHGQCSEQSLAAFQSTGYHSCLLRVDGKRTEAVKLCALRNLRSVDERLSPEELSQWEGAHPAGVLHVGRTPVMTAIWVDAFDGLHELRNAGASFTMRCPQDDDFTALHYAVKLHRVDMIRYILPLLPRPQLLARTRHDGDTPLHLAARYGHYDIVGMFMAHATKLYSEDTFVWKQLNNSSSSAVPPTSSLICQMLLSKSRSDGCTAAHLIAQCRTATAASEGVSVAATAGAAGRDFATPTALAALSCLLDCADEHDSMIPLLSSPQLRTSSGEHLLAACESPVLWQLVKSWCDRCGYEVSWSSPPALSHTKSFAGAKGLSGGVGATDEGEDEESLLESLLALRSRRASLIDSEACPNILLPLLTSDGDTPLHRLAEKANLAGGLGMVRLWLHCLVAVFPPSPYSSPTSVDPQWRHHVRDDAYTKVLEFASPRTGKSAWSTVIEAHGADNYTAQDMMNVALELDAQHEAATKHSHAANEGLFAAAEGAPSVAVSDLHVEPAGDLKSHPLTVDPPPTSPLFLADPSHRPSPLPTVGLLPPTPPIQTLQAYKLLTVFDNKRNARRLAHHLAYHSTPAAGLQWLRDSVIAELCKAVRVATQSIMMSLAATAADAAAKAEVASSVGRPISAGSALPSTPLVATKSQRSVSPPNNNNNNKDDGVSNPASQMLSPMTDRPRSRGAQFVDDANNASFRSTGSNETNHSRTTNGADINMTAEYEGTLTALSGQLLQLSSLYNDVLLSVDHDGFQPLFLAALRDNGDAVAPLCDISDAIASEALSIVLYMAQITAQMTKARRAAAAAAQAALDAAAAAKAMRRSNSNLKRTPSMSTNQQNSSSLQRVSSTSAMQQKGGDGTTNVNFGDAEALAVSQSGLALSASFAVAAGGGGGGAARPPSLLVRDVREALQQPQLIPQEFHPLLDAVLGELELNYAHAFQKEQEQNAAEQLRLQQQAATLETSASEVVVPPPPAVVNSMRGAGVSSTGSTAAITPVEDPAVAAQRRRAVALEALEWDGLMGSSPSTAEGADPAVQQQQAVAVPFVITTLNGAAAAQTIGVLLRAHHPIRVATSAFHQAVEAGGWSSSTALLSAVLTRWASETQRTVVQRDLASSMDVPRPTLEQCKSVLHAFLCNTGSDTNQHRSPMQIAVRRGDFRTVHSLTSLLMETVGRAHRSGAEHHHCHIAFPPAALQEHSLVGVIDAMTSSWSGGSGAFTSCAPLTAEALGHCLLSPTMSPTKRLVIIGAGTPIRAEPLTTMESSLYVASALAAGADDDDGVNNHLDDDVASMCCNGNGDHPVDGATYHQMHHHMAAVRCRCWLMMSDIHQLLAICHRVE